MKNYEIRDFSLNLNQIRFHDFIIQTSNKFKSINKNNFVSFAFALFKNLLIFNNDSA